MESIRYIFSPKIFSYVILFEMSVLFIIGIMTFTLYIPKDRYNDRFIKAFKLFGAALLVWALHLIPLWITTTSPNLVHKDVVFALSVAGYYLFIRLIGASTVYLLLPRSVPNIGRMFSRWALLCIIMVLTTYITNGRYFIVAKIFVNVLAIMDTFSVFYRSLANYKKKERELDNFYVDNIAPKLGWIKEGLIITFIWVVVGFVRQFFPMTAKVIYDLSGTILFSYLFFLYYRHLKDVHKIVAEVSSPDEITNNATNEDGIKSFFTDFTDIPHAISSKDNDELHDSAERDKKMEQINDKIEVPLNQWLEKRGYLDEISTIEDLSSILGTNRAYLSAYINQKYSCNFRNWIATLRMEHAKELIIQNPELSIQEIADITRYTRSGFSSIFRKHTGMTVSKWRSSNKTN